MSTEIRSYRAVFDLERRIYRVDRLRLNPGGIPVRGAVYFLCLLGASLLAEGLPLLGSFVRVLPWHAVNVALPAVSAVLLTMVKIEGRPFHVAAQALLLHACNSRDLVGWRTRETSVDDGRRVRRSRWWPPDIVFLPDGSDQRMRRLRYSGPGAVLVSVRHRREGRELSTGQTWLGRLAHRSQVTLREPGEGASGTVIVLAHRASLRSG